MTNPDDGGGGEIRVTKKSHWVFGEDGLERTSTDLNDKTRLIHVCLDVPDDIYRHILKVASIQKTTVELIMCEWLALQSARHSRTRSNMSKIRAEAKAL